MLKVLAVGISAILAGSALAEATASGDANCQSAKHAKVAGLKGVAYPQARQTLMASGWKPQPTTEELGINEQWAVDAGFKEVDSCAGSGRAPCLFVFADAFGNGLSVVTEGDGYPEYPPEVVGVSLSCPAQSE